REDKKEDSERYGFPEWYFIKKPGMVRRLKVHYSRVLHFATRLLDHPYKGQSVLEAVWDDLTTLRNVRWAMGQTMYRYGSGFPDVELQGATKKKIDDFIDSQQFQEIHARSYFVHNEKQKLEFKGMQAAALNPEPYYTPIMENISAGSNIPMAILRGAQAGALTGSEVNEREYFKLVSDAQSRYEWGLRFLIEKLMEFNQIEGVEGKKDFEIVWLGGFELNERDKAAAEFDHARTRVLETNYMTVDEVRAKDGLDPLPDGRGNVVLGISKLQTATELGLPYTREKKEETEK
ncbi:MAG: DUF1073 domain-containing protein, partial [Candidatus Bathyarchaeota archaeon]|nr:DUF1073 domain-containing protein [Candidatus Bathyarchaeota archaeon]